VPSDGATGRERSVVLFRVGDGQFAVDARAVRHVERAASAPGRRPRSDGRPWPRVPLRALFGLPPAPPAHRVLVEDADGRRGALEVDAVLTLAQLDAMAIAPLPAVYSGPERRWVAGLGRREGRVVILLHVGGVLVEAGSAVVDIAG
jgi:chemotaxis signal transduction protein